MTGGSDPRTVEFEGVDELSALVFNAFRRTIQLQRQFWLRTLARKGAGLGEAVCLRMLSETDGLSQSEVAERLHLSRPRVTKLLQSLEKAGTVTRRTDPRDQRRTRVFITTEGRRRERELRSDMADHINRTVGTLSEADRLELARLLGELADRAAALLDVAEEVDG